MEERKRRQIDERVRELRDEADSMGWKFRIVKESATEVVYKTREPGYVWRRFSVTSDGERELGGALGGEIGDGRSKKWIDGCGMALVVGLVVLFLIFALVLFMLGGINF